MRIHSTAVLFIGIMAASLPGPQKVPPTQGGQAANILTAAERRDGWRLLFDGKSLEGWRRYDADSVPTGWQAIDGALTRAARNAGDIITRESFRNFDLMVDWKITPNGNSGIFYRAALGSGAIYFSAPEFQILDDTGHADGKSPLTSAGSVYGLYPAVPGTARPVGEWNTARILVRGNHVEHWLNGKHIASYELGSPEWKQKVAASKFAQWPEYGQAAEGHIGVQDHGNRVAFRNIKVRVLP